MLSLYSYFHGLLKINKVHVDLAFDRSESEKGLPGRKCMYANCECKVLTSDVGR